MPVFVRHLLIGLAFVPLVCVLVLVAGLRFPWMDAVTVHMPMGVRTLMGTAVLDRAKYDRTSIPMLERVVRLDPTNALAWHRLCVTDGSTLERRTTACRRTIDLSPTPWNYKAWSDLQEEKNDWRGAEETMRIAQSKADTIDNSPSLFLRELGRLEMINGKLDKSLVDLLQAEKFDSRDAEFATNDDKEDAEDSLESDREYMVVLYDRMHQPEKSEAMCRKALPKATKPCGCTLDAKNQLQCAAWLVNSAKAKD